MEKPDWNNLPDGFPDFDLDGLAGTEIGKLNAIKTIWELNKKRRLGKMM